MQAATQHTRVLHPLSAAQSDRPLYEGTNEHFLPKPLARLLATRSQVALNNDKCELLQQRHLQTKVRDSQHHSAAGRHINEGPARLYVLE